MQCSAQSKQNHRQCRRHAVPGAKVCASHGGNAPQVKAAARVRLAMAADTLMAQLLKIALSGEDERVRLAAVNSALDRAGINAKQELEISQEPTQFDQVLAVIMRRNETVALNNDEPKELPSVPEPAVVLDPLPQVMDEDEPEAEPVTVKRPATTRPATRGDEGRDPKGCGGYDAANPHPDSPMGKRRTARMARARQVLIDAGEPVPGNTPTNWG